MSSLTFQIPITPQGKDRARARIIKTRQGQQFVSMYTTAKTRSYEDDIKSYATKAMRGRESFDGPLTVTIDATFPVPASWSNAKWGRAVTGIIRPTGKPDFDNLAKAITDACNKIVYRDDAQIVDCRVRKFYGKTPSLLITVRETEPLLLEPDEASSEISRVSA